MSIITVGIDLAKNVFAVHGVDDNGKSVLVKPKVAREHLLPLIAQLPPCLIGMEACSGAHHWARQFRQFGHTVRLMAPKFVIPYRLSGKRGKNDAADAAAICEAVTRPQMRFVPVKEEHQQVILALHRTRNGFVEERTATYNRLRGLISEFGIVCPQKIVACLTPFLNLLRVKRLAWKSVNQRCTKRRWPQVVLLLLVPMDVLNAARRGVRCYESQPWNGLHEPRQDALQGGR